MSVCYYYYYESHTELNTLLMQVWLVINPSPRNQPFCGAVYALQLYLAGEERWLPIYRILAEDLPQMNTFPLTHLLMTEILPLEQQYYMVRMT